MSEVFGLLLTFTVYALILGGLAVVVIRFIGRGIFPATNTGMISVLDRVMLAPNKGLVLIKIANKYLLLAVSDQEIKILQELDSETIERTTTVSSSTPENTLSFGDILSKLIGKMNSKVKDEIDKKVNR